MHVRRRSHAATINTARDVIRIARPIMKRILTVVGSLNSGSVVPALAAKMLASWLPPNSPVFTRTIFHVDMDAFFVSVEELFDPFSQRQSGRSRGQRDERGVVSAASCADTVWPRCGAAWRNARRTYGLHTMPRKPRRVRRAALRLRPLCLERRIEQLFHRNEEGVHIDVEDGAGETGCWAAAMMPAF